MLAIHGPAQRFCDGASRRTFLRIGALGLGGLGGISLSDLLRAADPVARSSAKSIIMIYLPGGPSHVDLFDPKPDAPAEVRGPFRPVETSVSGIRICALLPKLARLMDKLVIVRSLVGAVNRHEAFQCYTGRPGGRPEDREPAGGWPALGSAVSYLQGSSHGGVPSYVDVGPKMAYFPYNNRGGHDAVAGVSWPGFSGFAHAPFQLEHESQGDLVLNGITADRLRERRALLSSFEGVRRLADRNAESLDAFRQQAFGILTSNRLAEALDLEREDVRVRERYGEGGSTTSSFGGAPKNPQNLLLARRLVEAGVRCVTVAFGAWDWHGNRGGPVEQLGREDFPVFDHALAVLIEDLAERGLLDDVTVVVWGEFGRTPRINAKGGRDHWPNVASVLLAGGGMRTGQVIGATSQDGGEPRHRPVHFQDIFATLYHNLGIDVRAATIADLSGRPRYLVDSQYAPLPELI